MNMVNRISLIGLGLFMAGCACKPTVETVTKTVFKPIAIADVMLLPCPVTTPPSKDQYMESSFTEREELLTKYTVLLLEDLNKCNTQINNIKSTQAQQLKVYNDVKSDKKQE